MFKSFNVAKFETNARLCLGRIKLVRNKKHIQIEQLKKDVAELLRQQKQESARIRVEAVIRENLMLQAFEIMELYMEQFLVRSALIDKTKVIPGDMVEAVSSIIYAANRVSDLPELTTLKALLASKYGKEYAASASNDVECNNWQVNKNLIRCLLVEPPSPEEKLQMLSDIAQKYGVEWDMSESARVLLPHGSVNGSETGGSRPSFGGGGFGGGGGGGGGFGGGGMMHPQSSSYSDAQAAAQAAALSAAQAGEHAQRAAAYAQQFPSQIQQQQQPHYAPSPPAYVPPGPTPGFRAPSPPQMRQPELQSQRPQVPFQDSGAQYLSSAPPPEHNGVHAAPPPRQAQPGQFRERTAEEIQQAYDAAPGGPPQKVMDIPSAPPPAPKPMPSVPLPSPPTQTAGAAAATGPSDAEDEFAALTRRLDMLKRS